MPKQSSPSIRYLLGRIATAIALFFVAAGAQNTWATPSFAFYYGKDIPWEALGAFDVAVVEPGNVTSSGWSHRLNPGTTVAAYISVGEVHPTRGYFKAMRPEWKLGENAAWGSIVVDQAAPGWSAFYLTQVIKPLWDQGYRAFFLDTLDSFYLVAKTPEAQQKQIAGMASLIQDIKRAYPDAKLIFNRGFEILPEVNTLAYAVAAESLFQGWDAGKNEYRVVPPADRDWIMGQLIKCRDEYKLPVISIDYVPPNDRALARDIAQKIKALGVIPWVTNPALDMLGIGQVEVLPRQVLAIHDEPGNLASQSLHEIHRIGATPLNYLGLDLRYVYRDAPEMQELSKQVLAGRYAGVMTWFNRGGFQQGAALTQLLDNARLQSVPLVLLGDLPSAATMGALGVDMGAPVKPDKLARFEKLSPHVGYEIEPLPAVESFAAPTVRPGKGDVWLRIHSKTNGDEDVIAITQWGGFAADRFLKVDLPQDSGGRWVVNPVAFFGAAFKLSGDIPVPDVTTESGRRLLFVHVDGDGFPNRAEIAGTPLAPEVMNKEFLQRYRWPSTISVIEGEVAPIGLYKALSPMMEKIAREIFALPNVEMASHTYSHPFYWADAELGVQIPGRVVNLKIPGYTYDVNREITGARDYVNTLGPTGKKTRMLFWSGSSEPLATPVALAYKAGLLNMNGGYTTISKAEPSLTLVAPIGIMKGDYYQVYAPMQNENVYTNSWTGPFYGFERVIETFEMTDKPLRLKPVNIYYHTYIASKRASIASLHKVYGWAEDQLKQQKLHPVFASEYAERVLDWRRATVARTDAGLELRGGRNLRQWRVDSSAPLPAVSAAAGIAGHSSHEQTHFVHATKSVAQYTIDKGAISPAYLESANAKLVSWETSVSASGPVQLFRFEGHLPLQARFNAPACELQATSGQRASRRGGWLDIEASGIGTTTVILRCA
ncbi:MAG: bifunctional glycoside hydrolase 114/ polysaccharide deacetylase family protein [Polaromonas sp.]|nr:bifunctional glycoside hydrolase 114/ polysaccharide deacetylase family protein [Polaromonas sp.]